MAVATPVYERNTTTEVYTDTNYNSQMTDDERHNANMGDMLAKILNSESRMNDLISEIHGQPVVQEQPAVQQQSAPQPVSQPGFAGYTAPAGNVNTGDPIYLVQGARADSDLFRADSELNRAFLAQYGISTEQPQQAAYAPNYASNYAPQYVPEYVPEYVQPVQQAPMVEEEETDDQRPTRTTTQYRTLDANGARISDGVLNAYRDGESSRPEEDEETHSKISFTKRDKIIFGVVIGLIVAVFVLIIINSAVISSINADLASLDGQLVTAQQQLEQSLEELGDVTSYNNVLQYAIENGIID